MTEYYELEDDFGQITRFHGELLSEVDTFRDDKPKWFELAVYRTEAGSYVVRHVRYSALNHSDPDCPRINAGSLEPSIIIDPEAYDIDCNTCGGGNWAGPDRHSIKVATTAPELVELLGGDKANHVSRKLLADLSDVDDQIRDAWMVRELR